MTSSNITLSEKIPPVLAVASWVLFLAALVALMLFGPLFEVRERAVYGQLHLFIGAVLLGTAAATAGVGCICAAFLGFLRGWTKRPLIAICAGAANLIAIGGLLAYARQISI